MRNKSLKSASRGASSLHSVIRTIGRFGVPALGVGFALWGAAVITGLAATEKPAAANSIPTVSASAASVAVPALLKAALPAEARSSQKSGRALAATTGKSGRAAASGTVTAAAAPAAKGPAANIANMKRHWSDIFAGKQDVAFATDPARAARFAQMTSHNPLNRAKLASLFGVDEPVLAKAAPIAKDTVPSTERFGIAAIPQASDNLVLAYADPSPAGPSGALAALSAVSPQDEGALSPEDEANDADGTALFPDYEDTPEETPLPLIRPRFERAEKPAKADEDDAPRQTAKPKREKLQQLAFAKPDNPAEDRGIGNSLKNLFNRPKVGNGVAVYDISAAKVYMPDGSVLEAHSGIGEMADNPKYVHVKMKGPTPPHTYNLKMREKRFHGVEAIRMLPVDGRNKHGRDGFLTHSYLLRGGRAESHGCVAFKDYNKFLNAFKQGKVRQLVVVPGGGRAIARNVQKGRDA